MFLHIADILLTRQDILTHYIRHINHSKEISCINSESWCTMEPRIQHCEAPWTSVFEAYSLWHLYFDGRIQRWASVLSPGPHLPCQALRLHWANSYSGSDTWSHMWRGVTVCTTNTLHCFFFQIFEFIVQRRGINKRR